MQQAMLFDGNGDDAAPAGGPHFIPAGWRSTLAHDVAQPYFGDLTRFVADERRAHVVYPPRGQVFSALELTPLAAARVLILGQDPYFNPGQAHGLAFSVAPPMPPPPSLVNIFKELRDDLGYGIPNNGSLVPWAEQGVLLLNSVLTVRAGTAASHAGHGWERFTDAVVRALAARDEPMVFVLWGAYAQKKASFIDDTRHTVLRSAHPSPLAARNGFFGSKPFSTANAALRGYSLPEIDWRIPHI